jgi:two-component system chemotaxis response regulator CheB
MGLIGVGASANGLEALGLFLAGLPAFSPAIVVVVGGREVDPLRVADWLDQRCSLAVRVASHRQILRPGLALLAPADRHACIGREGEELMILLDDDPLLPHQRPSVDTLLRSAASYLGHQAAGVLLGDTGQDGVCGLLELRRRGGFTIAQDEASSSVWDTAGEAVRRGAAVEVLPLPEIAPALHSRFERRQSRRGPSPG